MGVAVTGMHYTGMAAMRVYATTGGIYGAGQGLVTSGKGAGGFVLPLVLGIGIFTSWPSSSSCWRRLRRRSGPTRGCRSGSPSGR